MNLFEAETLLIARLEAQLIGVTTVGSFSAKVAGDLALTDLMPAVFVMGGAGQVDGDGGQDIGRIQEQQSWSIRILVADLRPSGTDSALVRAGAIAASVISALHNWTGIANRRVLYLGHDEPIYEVGYLEVTLSFTTRVLLDWEPYAA
jgi:hypothetical protein